MVIDKKYVSARGQHEEVYECSAFNNLVQIFVLGDTWYDVVKDLVEKIRSNPF
jgi:hypothetical protein